MPLRLARLLPFAAPLFTVTLLVTALPGTLTPAAGQSPTDIPTEAPTPPPTEPPTPEATDAPTPVPTAEPTPELTEEPTEEPTPTPEPEDEDDNDDVVGGLSLLQLALILGALVLAAILLSSLLASRRRKAATAEEWDEGLKESLGEARWVHDVLSLDVANRATNRAPQDLSAVWQDGRRRMTDLESALYRTSSSAPHSRSDVPVYMVTDALRGLREALENDINLRAPSASTAPGQETLIEDSAALVSQRRHALLSAIQAVEGPPA
jgi:hypothetical protein